MTKVVQKVVLKIDWGPAVHFAGEVSLSWQRIVYSIHMDENYTFVTFYMFKESMASSSSKCILSRIKLDQVNQVNLGSNLVCLHQT